MQEKDKIVKESNVIARARIAPKANNIWEERIIALLLSKIKTEDKAFSEQKIDCMELAGRNLNGGEYRQVRTAVEELVQKTYIIPKGDRGVTVYSIFVKMDIDDDGNITAEISPKLHEHFLALRNQFALRSLPEFQSLSGTYSQQLFRYLNSWRNVKEIIVSVSELHDFLSVPPFMRSDYGQFRRAVLTKASNEINSKTTLKYTWESVISRGRKHKIEAVKFVFTKSTAAPITATVAKTASPSRAKPSPASAVPPEERMTPEYMAATLAAAGLAMSPPISSTSTPPDTAPASATTSLETSAASVGGGGRKRAGAAPRKSQKKAR